MERIFLFYSILANIQSIISIFKPIILYITGYNLYYIHNKDKIKLIRNKLSDAFVTTYTDEHKPLGFVFSLKYQMICYFYENRNIIHLICRYKDMKDIIEQNDKPIIKKIKPVNMCDNNGIMEYMYRNGDYNYFEYSKRNLFIRETKMSEQQEHIFHNIKKQYNENNNVKCYIHGKVNTGKTFLCYLMARELNCYLCDTFNPTEPSDTFSNLYLNINPSSSKPLILLLDEVDILLHKIHNNDIKPHKKNSIEVYNKTTWNQMLDKIDYGLYPYVILVLCSNTNYETINKLDPSYLRNGRIDLVQNLI